jgi:hypothetical protein
VNNVENPFVRIRKELGKSQMQMNISAGVERQWERHERGEAPWIHPQVAKMLLRLGYDTSEIIREYDAWREENKKGRKAV